MGTHQAHTGRWFHWYLCTARGPGCSLGGMRAQASGQYDERHPDQGWRAAALGSPRALVLSADLPAPS